MLDIVNLGKTFPDKKLFQGVNLHLVNGNTYGIIGANGVGKTTFLKILSNEIEATSGEIIIPEGKRISSLSQDQNKFNDFITTEVVIMGNKDLYRIQQEKDAIYANPDATSEDYERAAHLEEEFGNKGGWNAENDAQILLDGLGIDPTKWDVQMSKLKAGEKVKVLLAQALFGNPDILIMDEPTNHLDLKAIKWLEEFLIEYKNLVIVVSHDTDFLDSVCTHTIDIDFGGAKLYTGNYSFWKQSSQLALELQQKANERAEDKKKKLEEFIARFSANASKSSQATSRKKALDKISIEEITPSSRKYPFIRFELNRDPGKDLLRVENLSFKTPEGETLFENLSFSIHKNEKVVILGQDDIAKTKLLEIIMGRLQPTTGTITWGTTIKPDYFPNNNDEYFKTSETILEWISKWPLDNTTQETKDNSDSRMRSFLGRMLFSGDSVFKKVNVTSGGEKARLMFSRMMLRESNFLVFDQPLDHLDTESIDSVIEGIAKYQSSCIFTTYNRAFIKEVANVILEVNNDSSFIFRGSVEEYEKRKGF